LAEKYLGLDYTIEGRYEDGTKLLDDYRSVHPDDEQVLLALATTLGRTHHEAESKRIIEQLMATHSNSASFHMLWGEMYSAQGARPEATAEFRRALELAPAIEFAHSSLGILDLKAGQLSQAQGQFEAELASHPDDASAQYHLASILIEEQKPEEAKNLLRRLLAKSPDYAAAHYILGKTLLEEGDVKGAIGQLEAATRLDTREPYSHYQLARAYLLAGRNTEAQAEFKLTRTLKAQDASAAPHDEQKVQ
jgi:predicted Zn-dependent protease